MLIQIIDQYLEKMSVHTITLNPVTDLIYRVDRFEKGTTFRSREFVSVPAGKGINVSYILSGFAYASSAHVLIGEDEAASYRSALEEHRIEPRLIIAPILTRKHCTLIESSSQSVTHVQIHSRPIEERFIREFEKALFSALQTGDQAVFSGSLPLGTETDLYARWITRCRECGVRTVLDTGGDPLRYGVESSPWMLKANEAEAEELTGKPLDTENDIRSAAGWIQTKYEIPVVMLSLGARGLAVMSNGRYYRLRVTRPVKNIIDTVGCGDAVTGGFLSAWLSKQEEPDGFVCAIATATAAATILGPGKIRGEDVEEWKKCVAVESD